MAINSIAVKPLAPKRTMFARLKQLLGKNVVRFKYARNFNIVQLNNCLLAAVVPELELLIKQIKWKS